MGLLAKHSEGAAMIILLSCLAFLCQEKVLASVNDLLKNGEDLDSILEIKGMELKNDKLYFNGEEVEELQEVKKNETESGSQQRQCSQRSQVITALVLLQD